MALRSLTGLGAAGLRHRPGRSALTALGVLFGVAVLFGVLVTNASIEGSIKADIERVTGDTDVFVSPIGDGTARLPTGAAEAVAALPDVAVVGRSLLVPVPIPQGPLRVLGVDPGYLRIGPIPLVAGRLPAEGAREVVIVGSEAQADELLGITFAAPGEPITVVGVVENRTAREIGLGVSAVTSLSSLQTLLGQPDAVDQLRVQLAPGTDRTAWLRAHRHDVNGASMFDIDDFGAGFRSFYKVIGSSLTLFAVLALFLGAFLIHLTLSMAVVERTPTYGTLRALGATPRQVIRVVATEAGVLGAAATAGGLVVGGGIAYGLISVVGGLVNLRHVPLTVPPAALVASVVLGVGASLLAALLPARRAARLSPVVAMRGDVEAKARRGRGWIAGVALLALGVALSFSTGQLGAAGGMFAVLTGGVLVVPVVLGPIAGVLGRVTGRLSPGVGSITIAHLVRERARSSATLAIVMVVLAVGLATSIGRSSMTGALDGVLAEQFRADVSVFSAGALTDDQVRTVQSTPGVANVTGLGFGSTSLVDGDGDRGIALNVIDPATYFDVQGYKWVHGTTDGARTALQAGGAVLLPDALATKIGARTGRPITVRTTEGTTSFVVAATYADFGGGGGSLVVAQGDAQRLFGWRAPTGLAVRAAPGVDGKELSASIRTALGAGDQADYRDPRPNVVDRSVVLAEAHRQLDGFLQLFEAVVLLATGVGLLGLANTLAVSIVQRFREIGMLRAVGTQRRQIVAMVLTESVTLSAVAALLAIPLGLLISSGFVGATSTALGFTVSWRISPTAIPTLVVLAMVVALLAAITPARRAAHLTPVDALRSD